MDNSPLYLKEVEDIAFHFYIWAKMYGYKTYVFCAGWYPCEDKEKWAYLKTIDLVQVHYCDEDERKTHGLFQNEHGVPVFSCHSSILTTVRTMLEDKWKETWVEGESNHSDIVEDIATRLLAWARECGYKNNGNIRRAIWRSLSLEKEEHKDYHAFRCHSEDKKRWHAMSICPDTTLPMFFVHKDMIESVSKKLEEKLCS